MPAQPFATVVVRRKEHRVRARELEGEEQERMYRRFEEADKGYRVYRERTTRRIPVALLQPVDDG